MMTKFNHDEPVEAGASSIAYLVFFNFIDTTNGCGKKWLTPHVESDTTNLPRCHLWVHCPEPRRADRPFSTFGSTGPCRRGIRFSEGHQGGHHIRVPSCAKGDLVPTNIGNILATLQCYEVATLNIWLQPATVMDSSTSRMVPAIPRGSYPPYLPNINLNNTHENDDVDPNVDGPPKITNPFFECQITPKRPPNLVLALLMLKPVHLRMYLYPSEEKRLTFWISNIVMEHDPFADL